MISIDSLTFRYGTAPVFENLSIDFKKNLNVVIGPNAAGKSTLLKCLFGLLKAQGTICWEGNDLSSLSKDERRNIMAYLPQEEMPATYLTVFEVALLGRISSLSWHITDRDLEKVYGALKGLHIETLAERFAGEISGGQKKLVSIAQTLVRDPKVILMDEPTNSLDMQKQLELFDVIHQIIADKDIKFIIVMHDLNLSCRHAEQLTILDGNGAVYASGSPKDIVTEEMLRNVYGVEANVIYDNKGIPVVSPIRSL